MPTLRIQGFDFWLRVWRPGTMVTIMKTQTQTIMFTDIKGYTEMTSAQSHLQNALMLRAYRRLVYPIVRVFEGRLVKSIGDAFMVAFPSPTKAVQCAMAIEDRLWLHNQQKKARTKLSVRITLNTGEMRVERNDYFGEPVNIASRMEGVTPAGEIYISEATYLTMNRQNIATKEVGSFQFKGLPELIKVYQIPAFTHPRHQTARFAGAEGGEAKEEGAEGKAALPEAVREGPPYGGQFGLFILKQRIGRLLTYLLLLAIMAVPLLVLIHQRLAREAEREALAHIEAILAKGDLDIAQQLIAKLHPTTKEDKLRRDAARRSLAWSYHNARQFQKAQQTLEWLLAGSGQKYQDVLLKGHLAFAMAASEDPVEAYQQGLSAYEEALIMDSRAGNSEELQKNIVSCYDSKRVRTKADWLIEGYVKGRAAQAIVEKLRDKRLDFALRHWFISRLERLQADQFIDWYDMSLRDLAEGNCRYQLLAIQKLLEIGDPRAIGPLRKLGGEGKCASKQAAEAANQLVPAKGARK